MVRVTSEIGRLRKVLVHEPGPEVDRMVPPMMEDLLFDDILFGDSARAEHRRFRRLLQLLGVEVVEANDVLIEALASEEARSWLWARMRPEAPHALPAEGSPDSGEELVSIATSGLLASDDHRGIDVEDLFRLPPLPNWCFQRDPQVILGSGIVFAAMATAARWREGLLTRCLFRYHPELAGTAVVFDPLSEGSGGGQFFGPHRPRLEGGDILVLSKDIVAIGVSERTNMVAIELLAEALAGREPGPRWLELVDVPARRAYMHLDTVFTPVDRDAALVFEPVICGDGRHYARSYEIDLRSRDLAPHERGSLLEALAKRGLDLRPIACGGEDPVTQQREQWTDGANALALAPGVIVLYDRNVATADALDRAGFRVLAAEDVLLGRDELHLEDEERVCVLIDSHEMSRARGGPHCLTHPLERDEI